jgi:hypothetical protein
MFVIGGEDNSNSTFRKGKLHPPIFVVLAVVLRDLQAKSIRLKCFAFGMSLTAMLDIISLSTICI